MAADRVALFLFTFNFLFIARPLRLLFHLFEGPFGVFGLPQSFNRPLFVFVFVRGVPRMV